MRRIVAFDLGSQRAGYAIATRDGVVGGVLVLGSRELIGVRLVRLRNGIAQILEHAEPTLVVYEEVKRHMGTYAAQTYGMTLATLILECERALVPYAGIGVGAIKKFATGKGNAKKPAMIAAAKSRWGNHIADDNHADAMHLAALAYEDDDE